MSTRMPPALYLHVPFCLRRCSYCDFYIVPMSSGPIAERRSGDSAPSQTRFLDALERELSTLASEPPPSILYFGGGTPTELSLGDLQRLLAMTTRLLGDHPPREWSVEANPGTLTAAKVAAMAAAGVNRVSLGAQSFDPATLERLGRFHRAADIRDAVAMLRDAGISNISLDLIFSVPGTTLQETQTDLEAILALHPTHVSCYCLEYEPGSDLSLLLRRGFLQEVPDEISAAQYECIRNTLNAAGIHQYEISNFARPGFECEYNSICWAGGEYIGCGPAAFSHRDGERFENIPSLHAYCARLLAGRPVVHYRERLAPEARAREFLITGLRRVTGWDLDTFREATGFDAIALGGIPMARHLEAGRMSNKNGCLQILPEAFLVSDDIFSDLL